MRLRAQDPETLLVAWLDELNYLMTCRRELPQEIFVERAGPRSLSARLRLLPLERTGLRLRGEVKAAAYGGLRVVRGEEGLETVVVLDV